MIGGGDWGEDRLIPDIMRAALSGAPIPIRNPEAVRPWQHVLNPLGGYLRLAEALADDPAARERLELRAGRRRRAPRALDRRPPHRAVAARAALGARPRAPSRTRRATSRSTRPRRARELGWAPAWDLEEALARIVEWYRELDAGGDMRAVSLAQIERFATTASAVA